MIASTAKDGTGCQKPVFSHRRSLSRRAIMTGGSIAAALGLAACSTDPIPEPLQVSAPQPETELSDRINAAPELVISGAPLNVPLLKRFYARQNFNAVWPSRRSQAASLTAAVLRASDHGLDPDRFHAAHLQNGAGLPPLDRELLLSDAVLAYADALARGAVPVERRRDDQILAPDPVDVAAVLADALGSDDPAKAIEGLAPTSPTYEALRQALQKSRAAPALRTRTSISRLRTIEVNLERQRWLPRQLPADRAWVNVADERLVLYRAGQPAFSTRVVVGEDVEKNQSPEFRAMIDASFYNPPWVIPADIAKAEILPKVDSDPDYLTRNKMIVLANGEVEQLPGPEAGLGYIMFDMPNRFDVYLHDTPDRNIFSRENRRISHGCIRVQNPRDFAAVLTDQSVDTINQGIATGDTTRNNLPTPMPVFVVYQTAFVDGDGTLQFRPDFYSRDALIWRSLHEAPPGLAVAGQMESRSLSTKAL